jgi:methionine-rich copper-binding protein CopC
VYRLAGICAGTTVAVAAVLTVFLAARPQQAAVTATDPVDGAALARAPTRIELSFTGPVDPRRSHVSVRDGAGSSVNAGGAQLVEPERIRQPVHIQAAGDLTVAYHVTLADGAVLSGTLRFRVAPGGTDGGTGAGPASGADGTAGSAHGHGVDPASAVLLALDGVVVLGAALLLMRRPARRRVAPTRPRPSRPPGRPQTTRRDASADRPV